MNRLDLNAQKLFSKILKFSIKPGKFLNFEKFRLSNTTRLQITVVYECHMMRQDLNAKTLFLAISEFLIFNGERR